MPVTLTTPTGDLVDDPSPTALADALAALLGGADAEADLWLEDDEGWALSVVRSGDCFFENLDDDEESYLTLGPLAQDALLRLLTLLAEGRVAELRAEPWEAGGF